MPPQNLARAGLINGFRRGENGWGEGAFNANFAKLSSLIHISIKEMGRTAPYSNDPVGTAYIVATSNLSGQFVGHGGDIAYKDLAHPAPVSGASPATWYFQRPFTGMTIYNETDNLIYVYDNGWLPTRPPFVGVACNLHSNFYIPTTDTYLRVPFTLDACNLAVSRISFNLPAYDIYFTEGGIYQAYFSAESNSGTLPNHGMAGRIVLVKAGGEELHLSESATHTLSSNGDNLNRPNVQMTALFSADVGDSLHFAVNCSGNYTLIAGPRTQFSVHKIG